MIRIIFRLTRFVNKDLYYINKRVIFDIECTYENNMGKW